MAITQSSKQASEGKDLPFPDSEGGEGVKEVKSSAQSQIARKRRCKDLGAYLVFFSSLLPSCFLLASLPLPCRPHLPDPFSDKVFCN